MLKKLKQLVLFIHRWTGLAMSFLFVVWFLSGFIMIYHTFPKPRPQHYYHGQNTFSGHDSITSPTAILKKNELSSLTLEMMNDKVVYRLSGRGGPVYDAISLQAIEPLSSVECAEMVRANFSDSICKVEKLTDYDQWIPWSYYKAYFPIHKFHLDDEKRTQLYVASTTGRIVQETTTKSRIMAWLGAIPHWMYFKQLRLDAALWIDVVVWLSAIGCFACLSGIVLGFVRFKRRRKDKKRGLLDMSPYKKQWFRWHHITGFVFGFFVFTFILSGLMSLADVPGWMVKQEENINYYQLWKGKALHEDDIQNDFSILLDQKGASSIKKIVCRKVMERTFYEVYTLTYNQSECYVVEGSRVMPLPPVTEACITQRMQDILPQKQYSIQLLTDYTHYYSASRKRVRPLPVYEIALNDSYQTILYVHPQTGELLQVLSQSSKWQWWLYQGLHTFNFGWFRQFEWLRQALLIILSVGGTLVSVTALVLGLKFLKRKIKRSF